MARFAEAVAIETQELQQTVQRAVEEVADFARVIHLNLQQTNFGKQMRLFAKGRHGPEAKERGRQPVPNWPTVPCWANRCSTMSMLPRAERLSMPRPF